MLSEKLYRLLLVAYPREHRREYGELMVQLFRDRMRRDGGGLGSLNVWLEMIVDLVGSALKEHRYGGSMTTRMWTGNSSPGPIIVCAILLFFGFHPLREFIAWPLFLNFGLTWGQVPAVPVLFEVPDLFYWVPFVWVPFVFLTVSYLFVRRLGHHMLSQLWLYAITVNVIGLVYHPSVSTSFPSGHTDVWEATIIEATRLVVVILFARKVSSISFRHSLLFIGLTAAMHGPASFLPPHLNADLAGAWPLHIYITFLVGGVLLRGLAVWTLVNAQAFTSSSKTILPPVMAMILLSTTLYALASNVWAPVLVYYDWVLPMLIVPSLAVVVTYAVRVRGPGEPQPGLELQSM